MSFDPWTLGFQLLNFAVLLWVLFRVLFKPVREIMERRAGQVQSALDAADKARVEAEQIRAGLAGERERAGAQRVELLRKIDGEITEHRQRRLAEVAAEAQAALERGRALLEAERQKAVEELRELAMRSATGFAAALLTGLADPEIHRALLRRLPAALEEARPDLATAAPAGERVKVVVESAFVLSDEELAGVRTLLAPHVPSPDPAATVEPALLAGVRIRAGDRVYDFSLRGQLDALAVRLKGLS